MPLTLYDPKTVNLGKVHDHVNLGSWARAAHARLNFGSHCSRLAHSLTPGSTLAHAAHAKASTAQVGRLKGKLLVAAWSFVLVSAYGGQMIGRAGFGPTLIRGQG
jgi:hypothetical protein